MPHTYNPAMRTRARLGFLDGMRGLAALYVLLVHVRQQWDWKLVERNGVLGWHGEPLPHALEAFLRLFDYGHFAVAVFIVLSGFCLMMPVARAIDGRLPGGVGKYIYRRARRILPPYYAALLLSLALVASVPMLRHANGTKSDLLLPAFTPGVVISHLLLLHNTSPAWIDKINTPMWSVPPEWQIYFLLPLLLLPVWRRFGLAAVNVAVCVLSIGPHLLLHGRIDFATPWYLALFTFGLTAAAIRFSPKTHLARLRERVRWGWLSLFLWALFLALIAWRPEWSLSRLYLTDPLVGICAAASILFLSQFVGHAAHTGPIVLRALESRPVVWLGSFSYSLYLVHYPLLPLIHAGIQSLSMPPTVAFAALALLGVSIPLAVAYLFHLAFERPFLSDRRKSAQIPETGDVPLRPDDVLAPSAGA